MCWGQGGCRVGQRHLGKQSPNFPTPPPDPQAGSKRKEGPSHLSLCSYSVVGLALLLLSLGHRNSRPPPPGSLQGVATAPSPTSPYRPARSWKVSLTQPPTRLETSLPRPRGVTIQSLYNTTSLQLYNIISDYRKAIKFYIIHMERYIKKP